MRQDQYFPRFRFNANTFPFHHNNLLTIDLLSSSLIFQSVKLTRTVHSSHALIHQLLFLLRNHLKYTSVSRYRFKPVFYQFTDIWWEKLKDQFPTAMTLTSQPVYSVSSWEKRFQKYAQTILEMSHFVLEQKSSLWFEWFSRLEKEQSEPSTSFR